MEDGGVQARLAYLERELERTRDRLHSLEKTAAAVRYMGEQVGDLTHALDRHSQRLDTIARRALERPTAAGLNAAAGWVAVAVALAALLLAGMR